MLTSDTPEAWADALDAEAEQLLARAGIEEPPVDMLRAATALGFIVAVDERLKVRARHVQLPPGADDVESAAILLQPEPRIERRHWAVAHEIGEHHVHAVFARLGQDADLLPPPVRERTANALANRLLLPTAWFLPDGRAARWDLAALKRLYVTASYELIARRMLEADVPAIMTIFDHAGITFRRGNAGGRIPPPCEIERILWAKAHATGRIQQSRDHRCWVRVWPIHERQWKREIMRTELASDAFDGD